MAVELIVVGAGGFGRETLDTIEALNRANTADFFRVLGIVDDAPSDTNLARLADRGYPYLGTLEQLFASRARSHYVIGVGNPHVRARLVARFEEQGWEAATLVHPGAEIGSEGSVGVGSVVCAGAILSTNVHLAKHVHVNPGAIIGHDTVLKDYVSVNPGAVISGEVLVEDRVLIGASSVILQQLCIATGATVGAGACVVKDVDLEVTVIGVPAKRLSDER